MRLKKWIGKIHLWLGLSSGLVVVFLGITGCILAFQQEIEAVTQPYQYVKEQNKKYYCHRSLNLLLRKKCLANIHTVYCMRKVKPLK